MQHIYDKCGSMESFRKIGIPQVDRTIITSRYINRFCEYVQNVEKGYISQNEADEALDIVWETWKKKYADELQLCSTLHESLNRNEIQGIRAIFEDKPLNLKVIYTD